MKPRIGTLALHAVLLLWAAVTLVPLVWLLVAVFKQQADIFRYFLLPPLDRLTLDNFQRLFFEQQGFSFVRVLFNSLFVSVVTLAVQLLLATLGGFALAKYRFAGKRAVMLMMLLTMMIPPQVLLAPLYGLVGWMSLLDTLWGLIVPNMVSVLGMFLFRQSMLRIPDELLDAGRIDGCGELGLFWHVALPASRPMIGAFGMISFMSTWNSYLWPQIILQDPAKYTLPIALARSVGTYHQDYGVLMAGTFLAVLPPIVLFLLLQKQFIRGLTQGAVKG